MCKFYARILHQLLITSFVNIDMNLSYSYVFLRSACEIIKKYKIAVAS